MEATNSLSAYESGRAKWAGVLFAESIFEQRANALGVDAERLVAHAEDLYLAWACAAKDAVALAHFDRVFLGPIDAYVSSLRLPSDAIDELKQRLRIRLLVGKDARIGHYRGRGSLRAWVRTCAVRLGVDMLNAERSRGRELDALDALSSARMDPELAIVRNRYVASSRRALERTLAALDAKDKAILRMYFVEGLNIDVIGEICFVHRATVARWLARIRKHVFSSVSKRLQMDLSVSASECRGILDVVRDGLEFDLDRVLPPPERRPSVETIEAQVA
jgi:RNA polymerase sigma-70 factor (ECF subfamily)